MKSRSFVSPHYFSKNIRRLLLVLSLIYSLFIFYSLRDKLSTQFSYPIAEFVNWMDPSMVPFKTGFVTDPDKIISPSDREKLEQTLHAYWKKSGVTFAILLINSLNGDAIEPYGNLVFDTWKLGTAKEDKGLLFLLVKNDRRMRLEVGYGLEGDIPDIIAKHHIDKGVPFFRDNKFYDGINAVVNSVIGEPQFLGSKRIQNLDSSSAFVMFLLACPLAFFGLVCTAFLLAGFSPVAILSRAIAIFSTLFVFAGNFFPESIILWAIFFSLFCSRYIFYLARKLIRSQHEMYGDGSGDGGGYSSGGYDGGWGGGGGSSSGGGDSGGSSGGGGASGSW